MSQPCNLIVALPFLGPRFWSTLPRIIIHHLTPLLFLINPILCYLYNGMKTAGGCAFMPPVTEQSITLSFFLLSYPYFSTSFFHMFNMFFAIKSFNWCIFQCLGLQWLKRDISQKSQFSWNLYKSYSKSSVFYKTDNFDNTDTTKYVLESQVIDLVPCKKSKRYLLYFLHSELLNSGYNIIYRRLTCGFGSSSPRLTCFS